MRLLIDRLRREGGFAMPAVLIITFVCGLLAVAVVNEVVGDLPSARADQDRRTALDAAQAGVAWYSAMLQEDPSYWTKCATVPKPDGVNAAPIRATPVANGAADADTQRTWRNVTGSQAQYTVEMLPAPGYASCDPANAAKSMLVNGAFRVRVTGRVSATSTRKRSLIATFRKAGFMNYVYYTKFETQDPDTDDDDDTTPAATSCGQPLLNPDINTGAYRAGCHLIQWATGDAVKGPFHTEDSPIGCGSPTFGRAGQTPKDSFQVRSSSGYVNLCGGSGPTYNGTYVAPSASVDLPPDNQSLKAIASQPTGRLLTGRGTITLGTTTFTWQQRNVTTTYDYPANGLIYVQGTGGACPKYTSVNVTSYTGGAATSGADLACGTVDVQGTYAKDLTIAAANDIVVRGNIQRSSTNSTAMLGLVANEFVRVWHPVTTPITFTTDRNGNRTCNSTNNYPSGSSAVTTIQAGILAVGHSFIVDNFNCGAQLGTLNVTGAIAQKWRGPVATAGSTGYIKNYVYNDDFAYREPPNFLDPVQSAWVLTRQNEQFPAT